MLGKFSTIISSKIFSCPLFLFFFWDPYNSNVCAFAIVSEVSETILSSFHSFYFICSPEVISTILSSSSLICSASDSFQNIFNFSNCVVSVCLFFNSSRSLLIYSCIFSILFSRFLIIFILFQVICLFPLHLFGLLCF